MIQMLAAFIADRLNREEGATAVEYGLMVALIAVVIIGAVTALGGTLEDIFQGTSDALPVPAP